MVTAVVQIRDFGKVKGLTQLQAIYRIPGLIWLSGYQIPQLIGTWDKVQLESNSILLPEALVYCQYDVLPKKWIFTHSKTLGRVQGHPPIYLLWN